MSGKPRAAAKKAAPATAGGLPASFFLSDKPRPGDVTLANGEVHTLHFLDITQEQFSEYHEVRQSPDPLVRAGAVAKIISQSLCNPDGTPALTLDEAVKLKPIVKSAILGRLLDLNSGKSGN